MRLTKIKLAGFKSFVDPTTISFPSSLVGVVGPNGCGKSNIIDAVRWVMGEISAKHLRGESMADVIFNGSGSRKPVGQASVELVFDNSDGKLGGEYASFAEVSLKRVVSRDGTLELLPERRPLPAQGHHAAVPRHRPRLAQLRDHRAEHDLAGHRGERRRDARVPRGGRGHLALQGAPPRDRDPHCAHAREPRAALRPARRGREAAAPPAAPGRHGAALPGPEAGGAADCTPSCWRCGCAKSRANPAPARRSSASATSHCRRRWPSSGPSRRRSSGRGRPTTSARPWWPRSRGATTRSAPRSRAVSRRWSTLARCAVDSGRNSSSSALGLQEAGAHRRRDAAQAAEFAATLADLEPGLEAARAGGAGRGCRAGGCRGRDARLAGALGAVQSRAAFGVVRR